MPLSALDFGFLHLAAYNPLVLSNAHFGSSLCWCRAILVGGLLPLSDTLVIHHMPYYYYY